MNCSKYYSHLNMSSHIRLVETKFWLCFTECARTRYWLASQNVAKPSCCKNGSYRPVQCRGGVCFCVDSDGNQTGIETPENRVSELPCYKDDQYPFC